MTGFPDHYAALGIDPGADQEVITAAYRALAKKYHPDTGATAGTASQQRFEEVQQAYEVLRSPDSRRRYDEELRVATEQELDAYLAARRRLITGTRGPDAQHRSGLEDVRPEPIGAHPVASPARRSLLPFLVPGLLLLAVIAIAGVMLMPDLQRTDSLDAADRLATTVTQPAAPEPPAPQPAQAAAQPAPPPAPPAAATEPAAIAPAAPTSLAKTDPPVAEPADTTADGQPLFGSSAQTAATAPQAPTSTATPAPIPKPKPLASMPAKPPRAPKPPAAQSEASPPQRLPTGGPYRLVIFERPRGKSALAWTAGVFGSVRGCTRQGIETVQRRINDRFVELSDARIWYECHPISGPL